MPARWAMFAILDNIRYAIYLAYINDIIPILWLFISLAISII